MTDRTDLESTSLTDRLVLLGLTELRQRGETPAQTHDLREICRKQLPDESEAVVGSVAEPDVMRSLYTLESAGLVEETEPESTSPVGKGRPAYALAVDPDAVVDAVADSPLEPALEE
ncbi:hypothetical protein [Natrialbaceae archaeon AArc-T1-2]|uniref:hypothetical protein n=1 Tax=Natrialbaceae archaeon AArc-T1-2 TaxID=3053904 RepID=UPI00255B1DC8|nr:hypothetical protein [Natrialbaceae archaeon AArc-T1-2]WIV68406.1 hypothetical protein QQ977_06710 [Natrialbaceae archaeon AArc-T1-2]